VIVSLGSGHIEDDHGAVVREPFDTHGLARLQCPRRHNGSDRLLGTALICILNLNAQVNGTILVDVGEHRSRPTLDLGPLLPLYLYFAAHVIKR